MVKNDLDTRLKKPADKIKKDLQHGQKKTCRHGKKRPGDQVEKTFR